MSVPGRKHMTRSKPGEWMTAYMHEPLWHFDHVVLRKDLRAEMPDFSGGSLHPSGFNPLEIGNYEYAVEMMTRVEFRTEVLRIAELLAHLADPITPDEAVRMMATMRGWGMPVADILKTGEYVLAGEAVRG